MKKFRLMRIVGAFAATLLVGASAVTSSVPASADSSSFTYQPSHAGGTLKLLASTAGGTQIGRAHV